MFFQTVFAMESTQDRLGHNLVINRNALTANSGLLAGPQVGDAWQFSGNPLLSPRRILLSHSLDQFQYLFAKSWPAARPRFRSPEQLKTLPMPAEECLGLDVD